MRRHRDLFLAGKDSIGDPRRTRPDPCEKPRQGGLIDRRRDEIIFEIAGHLNFSHTEYREALRVGVCLRQTKVYPTQQRSGKARKFPPNQEAPRGQAGVDKREGNFAAANFDDEVWRNFRPGDKDDIWPPMIEKPRRELRRFERRELVQRWRQAGRVERAGRHVSDRRKHGEAELSQFFDKRRQGKRLRGARRVQQGDPPVWPGDGGSP